MRRKMFGYIALPLLLLLSNSSGHSASRLGQTVPEGLVPGPDAIAGDMANLGVFGTTGTQLGLASGITTCNAGNQRISFFSIPQTNHPVVAQNLYRMAGG